MVDFFAPAFTDTKGIAHYCLAALSSTMLIDLNNTDTVGTIPVKEVASTVCFSGLENKALSRTGRFAGPDT